MLGKHFWGPGPLRNEHGSSESLVRRVRARAHWWAHHRIAVLAIDPSNPFTRGALLGDRIRMPEASGDDGIFIRSVAGRGSGDGLSRSAGEMLAVLQYVGFGTVLLETVGAGQDELAVGALADIVIVVFAPGLGYGIQALKAGLLLAAFLSAAALMFTAHLPRTQPSGEDDDGSDSDAEELVAPSGTSGS